MNPINDQSRSNSGTTSQITFKLSRIETDKLLQEAEELGFNLSEFCRIKCISVENDVLQLKNQLIAEKKENRILRAKLSFYKDSVREDNSIIMDLTAEQRKVLERLVEPFSETDSTLPEKLKTAFIHLVTLDHVRQFFPEWKSLKPDDVKELFSE